MVATFHFFVYVCELNAACMLHVDCILTKVKGFLDEIKGIVAEMNPF